MKVFLCKRFLTLQMHHYTNVLLGVVHGYLYCVKKHIFTHRITAVLKMEYIICDRLNDLSQCCILGKRYYWNQLTESNEKLHWLRFNSEMGFEDVEDSEDEGKVKNM